MFPPQERYLEDQALTEIEVEQPQNEKIIEEKVVPQEDPSQGKI
jgi:hypothetical protein